MTKRELTDRTDFEFLSELGRKPAAYLNAARQIEHSLSGILTPVRLSVLSSFTADVIRPYLVVEGARRRLHIIPHFCPFNQFEFQAFNPNSDLFQSRPDVILIALRLEDVSQKFSWGYASLSKNEIADELKNGYERLEALVVQIRQYSNATILIVNFGLPVNLDVGFADAGLEIPQTSTIYRLNEMLGGLCQGYPGVFIFDHVQIMAKIGLVNGLDMRLWYTAKIPFSVEAQLEFGKYLARYVNVLLGHSCKCLVLDLDNTLWGGVLGEEGIGGIKIGEDYPGNIYKQFQRRLLSLRSQGILLAIASKNNRDDVIEALESHPDMLLRLKDFSCTQIHWGDKATSLKAIAKELNIGLDALAFFDDSPVERSWVRENIKDVTVIDVPTDPMNFINALEESGAFDRLLISADDLKRANMMQQSQEREQFRAQAQTVEEFLKDLDMTATVGELGPESLPRVVQLLAKTNQFNLTTRRHTAAQLQALLEKEKAQVLWMRLRDRFGDNGLVGISIGVPQNSEEWRIDSLLLSCRVIGRQAETVLLALLAKRVLKRGGKILVGEYIPTPKNGQVSDFYARYGFQPNDEKGQFWHLDLTKSRLEIPTFIQVEYNERK